MGTGAPRGPGMSVADPEKWGAGFGKGDEHRDRDRVWAGTSDLWSFSGHALTWLFFWEQVVPPGSQVEEPWGLHAAAAIRHSWHSLPGDYSGSWLCLVNFISSLHRGNQDFKHQSWTFTGNLQTRHGGTHLEFQYSEVAAGDYPQWAPQPNGVF